MTFAPMSPLPQPPSADAAEARGQAGEMLARTSALSLDANFAWFIGQAVGDALQQAAAKTVSTAATDRERDNAAHVHAAMLRLSTWVEDNMALAREAVNAQA